MHHIIKNPDSTYNQYTANMQHITEPSYKSPIGARYKASILSKLWSNDSKIIKMRYLWLNLAIYQKELGITVITDEGIEQMRGELHNIDYNKIDEYESRLKHDIVAHISAFGDICPKAKPFIHLGATSNFINDNVDMCIIKESLSVIIDITKKLFATLEKKSFVEAHIPTLAYTHLQQAQLITIGKRFTMWNADIAMDLETLARLMPTLPFRGLKGTVGTEDTILKLFDGDHEACDALNTKLANAYGFVKPLNICGQTYSRKYDVIVFSVMSGICQSIYKMMNDIRLLSGNGEMFEAFGDAQVGSSAMPYKKNPITCEKICSLCRYVITQESAMTQTYMNQWLERSLDDSAIKRIIYPECFMLLEHILEETNKCINELVIDYTVIDIRVSQHMHNVITEDLILNGVKMGYERIDIHERIRSILTKPMKSYEEDNKFDLDKIKAIFGSDEVISSIIEKYNVSMNPNNYIGRCVEQIEKFYCK